MREDAHRHWNSWRKLMDTYWNHNVAYHPWVLKHIKANDSVLDVGCGDGYLLQKLSKKCAFAVGLEPDCDSAARARLYLGGIDNVTIRQVSFQAFNPSDGSFDAIIFVASLHHINEADGISKAKRILKPNGRLIVVGCAQPKSALDFLVEGLRVLPAKIGSHVNGERNGGSNGCPIKKPSLSLTEIRKIARRELPGVKIRRGLYYRYLLIWTKRCKP